MRKAVLLALCLSGLVISCSRPGSTPAAATRASASVSAGARIEKPFLLEVSGADCYSGKGKNSGDVAFGFPNRSADTGLQFTIGPLRDGLSPGQENNKPYAGPGDYTNVGIVIKRAGQKLVLGYGTITVSATSRVEPSICPRTAPQEAGIAATSWSDSQTAAACGMCAISKLAQ